MDEQSERAMQQMTRTLGRRRAGEMEPEIVPEACQRVFRSEGGILFSWRFAWSDGGGGPTLYVSQGRALSVKLVRVLLALGREWLVLVDASHAHQRQVNNLLASWQKETPARRFERFSFVETAFDAVQHVLVPPQQIVWRPVGGCAPLDRWRKVCGESADGERARFRDVVLTRRDSLPLISSTDIVVRHLGGRPDDVLAVAHFFPEGHSATNYRRICP